MGEHKHKPRIKGNDYKLGQKIVRRPRMIKPAKITDKWLIKHGWVKGEDNKWHR